MTHNVTDQAQKKELATLGKCVDFLGIDLKKLIKETRRPQRRRKSPSKAKK